MISVPGFYLVHSANRHAVLPRQSSSSVHNIFLAGLTGMAMSWLNLSWQLWDVPIIPHGGLWDYAKQSNCLDLLDPRTIDCDKLSQNTLYRTVVVTMHLTTFPIFLKPSYNSVTGKEAGWDSFLLRIPFQCHLSVFYVALKVSNRIGVSEAEPKGFARESFLPALWILVH